MILLVYFTFLPSEGNAATVSINCNLGQSIGASLPGLNPGDTLLVTGICNENVYIPGQFNQITLDGQGSTTINSQITSIATIAIKGGQITIRGFVINGANDGIQVYRGGTAIIDNNTIQMTASGVFGRGIIVNQLSFAQIVNNLIQNNPLDGILVSETGSARIGFLFGEDTVARPNTIIGNGGDGISVSQSSNARIVGNTLANNGGAAVRVSKAAHADISSNNIDGNAGDGINVSENSGVNLGNDAGTGIFDAPNDTSSSNGRFGVSCSVGGYANGRLGTLNGSSGKRNFESGCINSLDK